MVKKAAALGFERDALLADAAGDEALVRALVDWRRAEPATVATDSTMSKAEVPTQTDDADEAVTPAPAAATPVPPAPAAATTKAARGGRLGSALAILLALAALGVSGWLWWQGEQEVDDEGDARLLATDAAIDDLREAIARLDSKLDENGARVADLIGSRGRTDGRIDDVADDIASLGSRVQSVEKSVDDVRGVSASARDNWVRAEAEYYLQTANSRLQLARDPDAALAALLAADDRIGSLGDPSLYRVRQTLGAEIEALRAVPRPDVEGIAHTLNGLASRVDEMPIANSSEDLLRDDGSAEIEGDTAMDRFRSTMAGVLGDIVSIRRTEADVAPLLSRDEEFFLRRNLELQLQTARLALLRGDEANYRESLRTARGWVQRHFVADASVVQSALETLTRLEAEDIAPALPDISGSLRELRRAAPSEGDAA